MTGSQSTTTRRLEWSKRNAPTTSAVRLGASLKIAIEALTNVRKWEERAAQGAVTQVAVVRRRKWRRLSERTVMLRRSGVQPKLPKLSMTVEPSKAARAGQRQRQHESRCRPKCLIWR